MPIYPADLTTLNRVREDKNIQNADDDLLIRRYIRTASQLWAKWTKDRRFVPYIDTKKFGLSHIDGRTLDLRDDLLSVTTLTNADGSTISSTLYDLRPDNTDPKSRIEIKSSGGLYWNFLYTENRVQVAGIWGFHDNYALAWGDSLDTVQSNPLSSSATTLTVTDVDELDDQGYPRFSVLDYLLVESEQMQVLDMDVAAKTLTVKRGVNGTTAAAHVQNTSIYTYRQTAEIQFGVNEIVKWLYEHRDKVDGSVQLAENLGLVIARELPEIKELAELYQLNKARIKAV